MKTTKKEMIENQLAATDAATNSTQNLSNRISMPRRIFVAGVAAIMSAFRIPDGLAKEPKETSENEFDDNNFGPPIEYLETGEGEDMLGGSAKVAGYYLHPECMIGCCHSKGPFPTKEAALEADRIRWEEIAKATKEGDWT
jgi:hypothetical protein